LFNKLNIINSKLNNGSEIQKDFKNKINKDKNSKPLFKRRKNKL